MRRSILICLLALAPMAASQAADDAPTTPTQEATAMSDDPETTETLQARGPMYPLVQMQTSMGDFVLELDAEKAPITVLNFIDYLEAGFYNNTVFHRVIEGFMIQGGGFHPDYTRKTEGLRPPIKNEWRNGLKNERGTIAMARVGNQHDSATSQFFINVEDNRSLDQPGDGAAYAVFGKVVRGMETVDEIRVVPTRQTRVSEATPLRQIVIRQVRLVSEFDREAAEKLAEAAQGR